MMLDPNVRQIYLSALNPPLGYDLNQAIATTFSLDLLTLLSIPLSFAKFEIKSKDELIKDPISVLEAVRRLAGRIHVFCQNGQIKTPSSPNPLFNYLEKMIIEVSPSHPEGVFHPKIWVLRFVSRRGEKILYRFLCLSRNITFDKSWDTILTLDGELRRRLFARNRALSDFIEALPSMAKRDLLKKTVKEIMRIAEEIRHVDFRAPKEFYEDFRFWPLGIPGYKKSPIQQNYRRVLIASPFLSDNILETLTEDSPKNILISRGESLDDLKKETLERFESVYVMDEAANEVDGDESGISGGGSKNYIDENDSASSVLHTKLYLADSGWDAHLWTGSANATNAGFIDQNVEFLVELHGKKSRVGIEPFLAQKNGVTSFRDLLVDYSSIDVSISKEEQIRKELKTRLEKARRQLSNAKIHASVTPSVNKDCYDLGLNFPKRLKFTDVEIDGKCWPISLKPNLGLKMHFQNISPLLIFQSVPIDKITSLFSFELKACVKSVKYSLRFVLNLALRGMPQDRDEKTLQAIVASQDDFLRYLRLLLYEGEFSEPALNLAGIFKSGGRAKGDWILSEEIPLFEELVRAYSRFPEKIHRISKLIEDLEEGKKIIPGEFMELWKTFQEAVK